MAEPLYSDLFQMSKNYLDSEEGFLESIQNDELSRIPILLDLCFRDSHMLVGDVKKQIK